MSRLCNILPVLVVLLPVAGCRSHRTTVTHEAWRHHGAVVDSTVSSVDTMRRVDSAAVQWLERAVLLEWDSVEYRLVLDSAGRTVGVSGKRVISRREGTVAQGTASRSAAVSIGKMSASSVSHDSVAASMSQSQSVEKRGGVLSGLECLGLATGVVVLAGMVVLLKGVLEKLSDRWGRKR